MGQNDTAQSDFYVGCYLNVLYFKTKESTSYMVEYIQIQTFKKTDVQLTLQLKMQRNGHANLNHDYPR